MSNAKSNSQLLILCVVGIIEVMMLGVLGCALAGWRGMYAALLGAFVHSLATWYSKTLAGGGR